MSKKLLSLLATGILLLSVCKIKAFDSKDLLFYAPFQKDINAEIANGNPKGSPVGEPRIEEIDGKKALLIENGKTGVAYDLKKNLNDSGGEGSIAFWISPKNWDSEDGNMLQMLFSTNGKKRLFLEHVWLRKSLNLIFFKHGKPAVPFPVGLSKSAVPLLDSNLKEGLERLKPGTWYHVCYTWRKGEIVGYLNGRKLAELHATSIIPTRLGDKFAIGNAPFKLEWFFDPGCENKWEPLLKKDFATYINEFAIFRRRLFPTQVTDLYKLGVKDFVASQKETPSELSLNACPTLGFIQAEAILGPDPEKCAKVECVLKKKDDESKIYTKLLTINSDGSAHGTIQTKNLVPGVNVAKVKVYDNTGKVISEGEWEEFDLAAPEEWWNNTLGKDDIVLPPWTPMHRKENSVFMWGREYIFDGGFFPAQIVSKDEKLLASPINLAMTCNGKKEKADKIQIKILEDKDSRVVRRATGQLGPWQIEADTAIEFDGFMLIKMNFKPLTKEPVNRLVFEIPLVKNHSFFIHTPNRTSDFRVDKPWKTYWKKDTSAIWLGDYDRGLQLTTESTKGWHVKNPGEEVQVIPENDLVKLRLVLVDSSFVPKKPFSILLGLQATPVKPVSRARRLGWTGSTACPWPAPGYVSEPEPGSGKTLKEHFNRLKPKPLAERTFLYSFIDSLGTSYKKTPHKLVREYKLYKNEWETIPRSGSSNPAGKWNYMGTCPNSSYSDWFVWHIKNRIISPEWCGWQGIYFDHGHARPCGNKLHGCGYEDENREWKPERQIFGMRKILKRIYAVVKGIDKEHPKGTHPDFPVVLHNSGEVTMPYISFVDFTFDGENFGWSRLTPPGGHYTERLPLDYMATEYFSRPWGYNERGTCIKAHYFMRDENGKKIDKYLKSLSKARSSEIKDENYSDAIKLLERRERELTAIFLQFDRTTTNGLTAYYRYPEPKEKIMKAYNEFGFFKEDVKFKGYWELNGIIDGMTDTLKAGAYLRPGKVLIAISNIGKKDVKTKLKINFSKLGLSIEPKRGKNAETGEYIKVENGTINITLRDRDYMLLYFDNGPIKK